MSLLGWAVVFLIIAIIAAIFGFGLVMSTSIAIAKVLFFLFIVVFIILLIVGLVRRA